MATKLRGWRFGVFEADLETHELRKYGVHIKLAGQPFQALSLLLQRPGEVVSREELRNALWPGEPWGDHDQRLNKAINKVRDALNDSADTPRLIETIPRVGYRFLGSVAELTVPAALPEPPVIESMSPAAVPESPVADPSPVLVPVGHPAGSRSSRWIAGVAVLVVAVAGLLYRAVVVGQAAIASNQLLSPSQAVPLTTFVGSEQNPAFSPDGQRIAFIWEGPAMTSPHIYTISVNGRDLKQLSSGAYSDYGPIWSPDGSTLAFMRESETQVKELWTVSAAGGPEAKIADFGLVPRWDHPLTWTKDAKWVVAAGRPGGEGPPALYLISLTTGERRRITSPPMRSAGDLSPALSPDGKRLAFTRGINAAHREIFVAPVSEDLFPVSEPVQVTNLERIIDTVSWSVDGASLYFSASPTFSGARHLFRVAASSDKPVRAAGEIGIEGLDPAISPDGRFLCYVRKNIEQTSIWRLEVGERLSSLPAAAPKRSLILSSTRRDYTADLSPDGRQIVFSSVRSGESEIWTSNIDGTNLRQVTFRGAQTPRWSPDGRRLAYESSAAGQPDVYVFDLTTNNETRLTDDPQPDFLPSWSRDGKHVYFGSSRTGRSQLFKVPVEGGTQQQITHDGGKYAIEAPDGNLYYTSAETPPSIRTVPLGGGTERTLVENVVGISAIGLAGGGLCYLESIGFNSARMGFYSFADHAARPLITIDRPVHHFLSSSPDGASVLFTQVDREDSDLMLLPTGKGVSALLTRR